MNIFRRPLATWTWDENAEGALETSPLVDLGSSFLEYVTEEQESSTGTGKENGISLWRPNR